MELCERADKNKKTAHRYIDNDDAAGLGGFIQNVHVQVEWIYLHKMLMYFINISYFSYLHQMLML